MHVCINCSRLTDKDPCEYCSKTSTLPREWELEGQLHRTCDDARRQINKAKLGAHVAATDVYLESLKLDLQSWIKEIEKEQSGRISRDVLNARLEQNYIDSLDCEEDP